jgi:adenosylcobinamide-GDP ribazoletransferase
VLYDTNLSIATLALIASATLSRACMPVLMASLPHARRDGLSHRVGQVPMPTAALGAAVALGVAIICLGTELFTPLLCAALICWGLALIAKRKIGGQTGDILGAAQQLSEIAILFALIS